MSAEQKKFNYDLIVIGGGSGGLSIAKEAAKVNENLRVLCFDYVSPTQHGTQWGIGGTCVNVGCVPKKLMHFAGQLGHGVELQQAYGWQGPAPKHDWGTMQRLIGDYVGQLSYIYRSGLRSNNVEFIPYAASFVDASTVSYTDDAGKEHRVSAERFVLAVGGRPHVPKTPGSELTVTSDDLLWTFKAQKRFRKGPGRTLVIGAGYIALECATFLDHLKASPEQDVSVMVRSQVMRKFDSQVAGMVGELMERQGIRFLMPADAVSFRLKDKPELPEGAQLIQEAPRAGQYLLPNAQDGKERFRHESGATEILDKATGEVSWDIPEGPVIVDYQMDGKMYQEVFDSVLVATGRDANVRGLGLKEAGVQLNNGKVLVDADERTSAPHIWAIGDCATMVPQHGLVAGQPVQIKTQNARGRSVWTAGTIQQQEGADVYSVQITGSQDLVKASVAEIVYDSRDLPELTPVAVQAGAWLARRMYGPADSPKMNYNMVPSTVFTSPEYGFVGLTTEEAERAPEFGGIGKENVEVWVSRFSKLEDTPVHFHLHPLRSKTMVGPNEWQRKYAERHGLVWGDTGYDIETNHQVFLDGRPGLVVAVHEEKVAEGPSRISYDVQLISDAQAKEEQDEADGVFDFDAMTDEVEEQKEYELLSNVEPSRLSDRASTDKFRQERFIQGRNLAKLVVDRRTDKVVGFHFVGDHAGEVTQGFALALQAGVTKAMFDSLVGIHPTAAEEFAVLEVSRSSGSNWFKMAGCGGGSCG